MSEISHIPLDEFGHVSADLPCISCGYNLRGLSPDSVCPECGIPIGRSQYGNLLRYSDPTWVKQLSSGMNWVIAAIIVGILSGCVGQLLIRSANVSLGLFVSLVPAVLHLLGYIYLTAPDPSAVETEITARQVVRGLAVANFVLTLATMASALGGQSLVVLICTALGQVVSIAFLFALGRHMSQLAFRIPDPTLARRTRIVVWGFLICTGIAFFAALLLVLWGRPPGTIPGASTSNTGLMIGGGVALVAGVGMLVLAILSLILIIRYQSAFKRAAQMALLTWASEPQPLNTHSSGVPDAPSRT